ncbi:MAG: hypothetical protein ACOYL8_03465 [Patescibacteria group bacterium]
MEKNSVFSRLHPMSILTLLSVIASVLMSLLLKKQDFVIYYFIMPLMACVSLHLFYFVMISCQGWRVFRHNLIFGMPERLFMSYVLVAILLGLAANSCENTSPENFEDYQLLKLLIFNLSLGMISSLIAWFSAIRNETAKVDEYKLRVELMCKGWSQEKIDSEIKKFKDLDLV